MEENFDPLNSNEKPQETGNAQNSAIPPRPEHAEPYNHHTPGAPNEPAPPYPPQYNQAPRPPYPPQPPYTNNQYYQQPPYQNQQFYQARPPYMPQQPTNGGYGLAIASMVLGIIGILFSCCLWFISIPCGILSLIFGIIALIKRMPGKGMAITGIVLSAITIGLSLLYGFYAATLFTDFPWYEYFDDLMYY